MFKDISLSDYNLSFELQHPYFLRDCLYEEISFDYEKRPVPDKKIYPYPLQEQVIIYKKLDNGISEEISLDELIFYIHTDVANEIDDWRVKGEREIYIDNVKTAFTKLFSTVDSIKKTVENVGIVLKYDKTFNDETDDETDGEDEDDEDEDLMKEVSTLKYPKQITYAVVISPAMKQTKETKKTKTMKTKIL
jgi:hypothetical protein